MKKLKILGSREKEAALKEPCSMFGIDARQFADCVLLEDRDELWIVRRDCLAYDLRDIPVESVGMLFARKKHGIHLTVNAVQLFFSNATKNTLSLTREEAREFIRGASVRTQLPDGEYLTFWEKSALDLGVVRANTLLRKNKT